MKNYTYTVLLLIALLCACSKEDYLDVVPKGVIVPTKVEDYRLMLDDVDTFLFSSSNDQYLSDEIKLTDDENLISPTRYPQVIINNYLLKDNSAINQDFTDNDWEALFRQIYISNIIINGVPKAEGDETTKAQLLAEAKTHRAYAYLILVNLYAKHYSPSSASTDLGLPLLTEPLLEGSLKRATVKETYNFILEDLNTSVAALPDFPKWNHQPSKASAYAILARVYLYMGDFDKAFNFSNESLKIHSTLIDYTALPPTLFAFLYPSLVDFPIFPENTEALLVKSRLNFLLYSAIELSDTHTALFDTANDVRYKGVFAQDFAPPRKIVIPFDGQIERFRLIGPSVPEMMLTKAECLARNGEVNAPIDIVNELRKYRIENAVDLPYPTSSSEALKVVKEERQREFTIKGLRWYDIKRYNAYDNANITLTRTYKGETVTLAPGDNRWVFPIARKYNITNPELELNPR